MIDKRFERIKRGLPFLFLSLLVFCGMLFPAAAEDREVVTIATIWDAPRKPDNPEELDFTSTRSLIQRERDAFLRGLNEAPGNVTILEKTISERGDVSSIMTVFAETYNSSDILMTIGASSDVSTMYAAMETNFFSIPMLIPYSDGDLSGTGNNSFVIRMTPTSQDYETYFETNLFFKSFKTVLDGILFPDSVAPEYDINAGVFFTDDFNSQENAILITQKMMDSGINVEIYHPYEDLNMAVMTEWTNEEQLMESLDVVLILASNQDGMDNISSVLNRWGDPDTQPVFILIGYTPEFDDPALWQMNNVFAFQQDLDMSQCPADIISHQEAAAYASGYITKLALAEAAKKTPNEPTGWRLWFRSEETRVRKHLDHLETFRGNVLSELMEMNDHIPCFGIPRFNRGGESGVNLELVHYNGIDSFDTVAGNEVVNMIIDKVIARNGLITSRSQ